MPDEDDIDSLVVRALDWHRWMANGSLPPDREDTHALRWLDGYLTGAYDEAGRARIRARLLPTYSIMDTPPADAPIPKRYTVRNLQAAIRSREPKS